MVNGPQLGQHPSNFPGTGDAPCLDFQRGGSQTDRHVNLERTLRSDCKKSGIKGRSPRRAGGGPRGCGVRAAPHGAPPTPTARFPGRPPPRGLEGNPKALPVPQARRRGPKPKPQPPREGRGPDAFLVEPTRPAAQVAGWEAARARQEGVLGLRPGERGRNGPEAPAAGLRSARSPRRTGAARAWPLSPGRARRALGSLGSRAGPRGTFPPETQSRARCGPAASSRQRRPAARAAPTSAPSSLSPPRDSEPQSAGRLQPSPPLPGEVRARPSAPE